ncbi:hypothetical protein YTPLAS72_03220 [Nitrospira sp.]|nr:hypothetical protein YTPLAS72_03220 [Nitrospira sp.]
MEQQTPISSQVLGLLRGPAECECEFETLVTRLPQFTWNELNAEVSRLSRIGEIIITRGVGIYTIRLAAAPK